MKNVAPVVIPRILELARSKRTSNRPTERQRPFLYLIRNGTQCFRRSGFFSTQVLIKVGAVPEP